MPSESDEAVTALYQAPLESFVAERQRLSSALKASGDKAGAARVAKLARPSISAWAVNQLWWHARPAFEELFETAAQLRAGKLAASGAHRKALAALSARAQQLLTEGGHAESPGTLRRITMTLSGLAAAGGFEPEPAGALSKDRDPPGFEAFGGGSESASASASASATASASAGESESAEPAAEQRHAKKPDEHAAAAAKQAREAAAAEKRRVAEERAQRAAERKEAEAALRDAKAGLREREHARERVSKELTAADSEVTRAHAAVEAAEARLASVKSED